MWTFEKLLPEERQINYTLAYQAEKMLVPTPPYYENDVMLGTDDEVSAIEGIFQSFYDAPFGFREELHEILHKFGGEILYKPKNEISYTLRGGYFSEHSTKGNRKFGTTGIGLKYRFLYLDLAYIIISRQSVYANTININLGFQKMLN
ncbi:MAG: PorV/PorQ family protein [Bacteroidales bacterium]|nr:PorV/PorQ family protein [Bacteroidales bacterium]